jgi:putative ATPase
VERPSILIGSLDDLPTLLTLRDETDLKFDRIIGRNPITNYQYPITQLLNLLKTHLAGDGRLTLIQTIPRYTQRLYQLVEWPDNALRDKVAAAEEAIYHDESDPLVNWDENDLAAAFAAAGLDARITLEKQTEQRRLTADHLARWFPDAESDQSRPSYAQRLRAGGLTDGEVERVREVYGRYLLNQLVNWQMMVALITAVIP